MEYNLTREQEREAVADIAPYIVEDMKKSGVLASLSLSQWILESYYGNTELALEANNFFGMKCNLSGNTWPGSVWDGVSKIRINTEEQEPDGTSHREDCYFRAYSSPAESIADHSAYLLGARDGDGLRYPGLKGCTDPAEAVRIVKAGGYATDINYVAKLLDIIDRFDLTEYDRIAQEDCDNMGYQIINVKSASRGEIKAWGNAREYIAIHYIGVTGEDNQIHNGYGAHYYIYKDGSIYWAADHSAILYQVGTAGVYIQLHERAGNANTIGIEMCVDYINGRWVLREATQKAAAWLTAYLMRAENIPPENVLRHGDIVSKVCPEPYMRSDGYLTNWTWKQFLEEVAAFYVDQGDQEEPEQEDKEAYLFSVEEVRAGSAGLSVLLLSEILTARGYTGRYGEPLGLARYADENITCAAARYMEDRRAQGVDLGDPATVGPLCWADLFGFVPVKNEGLSFSVCEVRKGSTGLSVLLLQEILRARGYLGADGKPLDLDRKAGNNTMYAAAAYMEGRGLDGVDLGDPATVGPKCWADLIALPA